MTNRSKAKNQSRVNGCPQVSRKKRMSRGQSMVEFALMSSIALAVMLIGVQFALIGQAALAVSQGASALARYAAVNPGTMGPNSSVSASSLPSAAQQLLSSSILTNAGTDLTVTVASYTGTTTTATSSPGYTDRTVVSMSYNAASKIFLPSSTLLGITFPTTLTASDSQMYE
ncbi:TadE/TadG family type IV pilus assembly protein [Candidatus Binatus sp.]|uniref:TadE/TadG family type IV pilus assembly protein n=2 Tax=Candidatus Binatus sp. TaxID=2811406 RepID=UPI003C6F647E